MLQRCARFMSSGIYILRAEHWNASYDQIAHVGPYEDTQTRLLLAFLAFLAFSQLHAIPHTPCDKHCLSVMRVGC